MMSTECTTLESSTPPQPYSSSKMFTCDHQSSVINSSYASTNTLIKNFPFPTFTPSATASASTNPLSSLNSTITTSAYLPVTPSSTLSSAKDKKLSNGEISQEKDINSGNFQLTPEDSYPSECKSSIYLSNQQINSCKYTLPIREAIISPNPFMNKMNITDVMKSHHSLRSVTTTKRAKDHQSIYHKFNKHCTGCNQPIFEKLYLGLSDGQLWHMNCLICHTCGKCLDKEISCFNRYGQIYCRKDYEQ
ncbi:unnamed protein product [Trichobilharzia regenti]|nr:unnamed protein product [Trichobilharzia regenti]